MPKKQGGYGGEWGKDEERESRGQTLCLPYWTKLLHLWLLLYFNKISELNGANKSLLISILYMNLNFFRFTKTWGMGTLAIARDNSPGLGRVPPMLRQAMLGEEVTGRTSLKLAAPGEQGRQPEGTAAGTPL